MLRLHVKGKPVKRWCPQHERLHAGTRCPRCVADFRWTRQRYLEIAEMVRRMEERRAV